MNKIMSYALCLCTLFVTGVIGIIIKRPMNSAMSAGGEMVIDCSSNTTGAIKWTYTTACNIGSVGSDDLTDINCNVIGSYASHYRTEKPDVFVCNLVVFDATLSLGGCYVCAEGSGPGRTVYAFLIVVDSNPNISTNTTDLITGEDVTISNTVTYGGPSLQPPTLAPSFYWTLQSDTNQNISSYPGSPATTSNASSYIVAKAEKPDVPSFVCNLFFNSPVTVPDGCANNAPTYRTSWVTPIYKVSYAPENLNISGIPNPCWHELADLTCSASGYPPPTYRWLNVSSGIVISQGNTVAIGSGGSYQCFASNTIRNVLHNASTVVNVSDCREPKIENITASSGPCDSIAGSCKEINSDSLTCKASGFPEPEYEWSYPGGNDAGPTIVVKKNFAYTCTATNYFANQQHSDSSTLDVLWLIELMCVDIGLSDPACISMIVLVVFFGLNLLFFVIFIICYGCSENGRDTLNDRFPWLKKMLPCMNDEGCICSVWIVYFVLLSIFAAFVFFPTILIMASCCPKSTKTSQGNGRNMPLSERNGRGVGGAQVIISGQPTSQYTPRMNVTPNPPSSLDTSSLSLPEHPMHRPYPHSSDQQRQPTHWGNSADPYHQTPRPSIQLSRNTPSPALSSGAIVYAELGVDNQPKSRRPIQPIQNEGNPYADIAIA